MTFVAVGVKVLGIGLVCIVAGYYKDFVITVEGWRYEGGCEGGGGEGVGRAGVGMGYFVKFTCLRGRGVGLGLRCRKLVDNSMIDYTHFHQLSHSEIVGIEKVAVCSSLRSLRSSALLSLEPKEIIHIESRSMTTVTWKRLKFVERIRSSTSLEKDIDKQLYERRLMWNLEKFIGGREYGNDLRLLEQTI
ncbi:hypothetical protein Tco_0409573 [Tanacetum coccineum]